MTIYDRAPLRALRDHWPLLAALCLLVLYDAPLLAMRGLALGADGLFRYYPAEYALAGALARHDLPFWAPEIQAGFPVFADGQPGGLYPFNLLAFGLLPTPIAHNTIVLLHHFLGLLFTFWWGRTLRLSRIAAAWMALIFSLTTSLRADSISFMETVPWIPLVFTIAERFVRRRNRWALWSATTVAAVQWLAGFPQIALYTALTSHLYLAVRVCEEDWRWPERLSLLFAWSSAAVIAILVAAPQLLPMYELSQYSVRAGGIQGSLAGEKSLFPAAMMALVLPSWEEFFWKAGLGGGAYVGVLPCLIAMAAIVGLATRGAAPRERWFYPLLAVTAVTTILAFGHFSPLFPLIRRLPGFAYFRVPSRFLIFTQFGLVTFFAMGWDCLAAAPTPRMSRAFDRLLKGGLALALLNVLVGYPVVLWLRPQLLGIAERITQRYILTDPYHVQPLAYYQAKSAALYDALTGAVSWRNADVLIPLTAAVGGWLIWSWSAQVRQRGRWRQMLWGLLVLLDVFAYADWRHATDDPSWIIKSPPTAKLLQEDRAGAPYRLFGVVDAQAVTFHGDNLELLPANYVLITGLSSAGLYAPLGFDAYYRLMQRLGGVDLGFGSRPVSPDDITHDRALLDFINVRYVLSRQPLTGFTPIAQIGKVFVYQNDHALPRAFAVDRVESVASTDAALEWITAHPDQLRDTAVVEAPLPLRLDAGSAQGTTVSVADYRPTEVTIDIRAHGTLLLVLSDTYYPGWQAWLDERPTAIYRTQAVFRSVLVPAGSHRVRFRYAPTTFRRGLLIAGIGALLFVGLIVASRRLTPVDL